MLPTDCPETTLQQLLRRKDIWRGHSQTFVDADCVDSGYYALNQALLHRGWPLGCVIEVCQDFHASEWCLFHPAMAKVLAQDRQQAQERHPRYLVLLNPPTLPFINGLAQLGLPNQRIIVVQTANNQEFISAFVELSRSQACAVLMSWQPKRQLSYTQLRKIQLASAGQSGLYILFRHTQAKLQSSPASLRLLAQPQQNSLHIRIFKQKGKLHAAEIHLAIPTSWEKIAAHKDLGRELVDHPEYGDERAQYAASGKGRLVMFPKVSSDPRNKTL